MCRITMLTALLAGLLLPGLAWADNTTISNAYSLMVGGTPAEATIPLGGSRWYVTSVFSGRSYCAETQGGVHFDTSASAGNIDTVLVVYRSDGTTLIGSNDDAGAEPAGLLLSRVCFVADTTETARLQVRAFAASESFNVRVRIVETTLFSNWFFVGGDYQAYTMLRNTTNEPASYTIRWRNGAGAVVGSFASTINANSGTYVNATAFPGAVAAVTGTVEIVHSGSPDAIVASTTVLSTTTGLSFDAPFVKRQPW